MTTLLARLADIGVTFVELLLLAGFAASLLRVATGHREGCLPLVGITIALIVLALWRGGVLGPLVQALLSSLLPGAAAAPGPGALP